MFALTQIENYINLTREFTNTNEDHIYCDKEHKKEEFKDWKAL